MVAEISAVTIHGILSYLIGKNPPPICQALGPRVILKNVAVDRIFSFGL